MLHLVFGFRLRYSRYSWEMDRWKECSAAGSVELLLVQLQFIWNPPR